MEFRNRSNRYIVKNRQGATAVARKEGREREMAHTEWDGGNAVPYNKEKKSSQKELGDNFVYPSTTCPAPG